MPGALDITGTATASATVSVNDQATVRKGEYFYKELAVDNSTAPVSAQVNVIGARNNFGVGGEDAVTEKGGRLFMPRSVETFTYDDDGNLTSDGRWNYSWDAENRLVSMEAIVSVPAEAKQRLEFVYDWMGRRIEKKVSSWNVGIGTYLLQSTTKFVYEGWSLIAELDGANTLVRSTVWSGRELLLVNAGTNTYQVGYDGNENVVALVKAGTGTLSALYDYDPFGQTLQTTGEYASQNPFRFGSKYTDLESGLIYYGFRFYTPSGGRWLSRDPLAEEGGLNLYGFVNNNPKNRVDLLGLKPEEIKVVVKSFIRSIGRIPGRPPSIFAHLPAWAALWQSDKSLQRWRHYSGLQGLEISSIFRAQVHGGLRLQWWDESYSPTNNRDRPRLRRSPGNTGIDHVRCEGLSKN